MPRWIVFDEATAVELRSRVPQVAVFEAPGRAALEYALENPRSLVTVLPPAIGDRSTIAVFRPGRRQATPLTNAASVRAAGILGLNDEWVPEEEEQIPAKKWWRFWKK